MPFLLQLIVSSEHFFALFLTSPFSILYSSSIFFLSAEQLFPPFIPWSVCFTNFCIMLNSLQWNHISTFYISSMILLPFSRIYSWHFIFHSYYSSFPLILSSKLASVWSYILYIVLLSWSFCFFFLCPFLLRFILYHSRSCYLFWRLLGLTYYNGHRNSSIQV